VVASWGPTHEEYVLAAIAAGKQVFCEKPLATTREACERIVDAEAAAGKRLVMVGFMRRYDAGYRAMRDVIGSGAIGAPLMFHSAHRNPSVPSHYVSDMIINDTCVHDVDVARFLLDTEVTAARVVRPRRNRNASDHLQDPLLILLETATEAVVDIEASINIRYAYDIRGEVVGESGTVELAETNAVVVKSTQGFMGRVPEDWRERFIRAYDTEFQEWINAVAARGTTGPSSWDGYAATVVCDAALEALKTGERVEAPMRAKPDLYGPQATAGPTGTD
jgi:myo-inositol 2-dehydrogenase/D-chiro-inositol 1-dehydrogenase